MKMILKIDEKMDQFKISSYYSIHTRLIVLLYPGFSILFQVYQDFTIYKVYFFLKI